MQLNDLLRGRDIAPEQVLVLRHRPYEPQFNKVFPMLAMERPDLFDAYQQSQGEKLEKAMAAMLGSGYVASFVAHGAGKALFIGLFKINSAKTISHEAYWKKPANIEMRALGMTGFTGERPTCLWFDLSQMDFYKEWRGKLIVGWPPPERSWWRRAHRNDMALRAVLEESAVDEAMKDWREINLTWSQLRVLPARWRARLSEWRAIYYIFDSEDAKGYVGSSYGTDNLLGRWMNYSATGHGGNRLLRQRNPQTFIFSILERVSPDLSAEEVIRLEATWKERLHTRAPLGLNDN